MLDSIGGAEGGRTLTCAQRIYDSHPLKIYGFGVAAGVAAGLAG